MLFTKFHKILNFLPRTQNNKEVTFDDVIGILKKHPNERSEEQIEDLTAFFKT